MNDLLGEGEGRRAKGRAAMVSCQPGAPGSQRVSRWSFVPGPRPGRAAARPRGPPGCSAGMCMALGLCRQRAEVSDRRVHLSPRSGTGLIPGVTGRGVPHWLRGTNPSASHSAQKQNWR